MPECPADTSAGNGLRRFLHQAHVFGSVVQEILEEKYLREASSLPLSVAQLRLLKLVALEGEHQVGEVAEILGVSSPAASKSIDKLEGLGLVMRVPSSGDRRVTLLAATEEGNRLLRRYERTTSEHLGPVLERVGPADVERLTTLLERFSTSLFRGEGVSSVYCLRCAAYGDERCGLHAAGCPYLQADRRPAARVDNRESRGSIGSAQVSAAAAPAADGSADSRPTS